MTGDDGPEPSTDASGSPADFDRLDVISERLATADRFIRIDERPAFAPERLVCVYDSRYYPTSVQTARLEIVWFENGDFSLHYHEDHDESTFDQRWDRHPSDHNTRDHVYPGPDAPTPGNDAEHPRDWRDTLSMVLDLIEDRQRGFWRR